MKITPFLLKVSYGMKSAVLGLFCPHFITPF